MVELADTGDLKSPGPSGRAGSTPAPGTKPSSKTGNVYGYLHFVFHYVPRFERGVYCSQNAPGFRGESYPPLFPTWEMLKRYKRDRDCAAYTKAYYREVLARLDPEQVFRDLDGKVLLCWERSNSFCHRRLVAYWLETRLSVRVPELYL